MTGRRVPLNPNPNVANSPLRAANAHRDSANPSLNKQKRPLAQLQREEHYGNAPPAKKQMLDGPKPISKPPPATASARTQALLQQRRAQESRVTRERTTQRDDATAAKYNEHDVEEIRTWQKHHRARFPKMVFFFDHVPEDQRYKLAKQVVSLGAREEKFFSINITHVVTTRHIPTERVIRHKDDDKNGLERDQPENEQEQAQTINPSLLSRPSEPSVRRNLFDPELRGRKMPTQQMDDMLKKPAKKSTDILSRSREMGKKIYSVEKLQRILAMLFETDPYVSTAIAWEGKKVAGVPMERQTNDRNLFQLLQNERVNGPSDRDHTVASQDLVYFKGPYIYVYDMDEKQKPIMVREYEKVADRSQGDWPQFRTAAQGRCPFIEDTDTRDARDKEAKAKAKAARAAAKPPAANKPVLQPATQTNMPKPVIGKRTISEMQNSHSRNSSIASAEFAQPAKPTTSDRLEGRPNAFTSRAAAGRALGGEPVASGVQPSTVTSAIRSQMISSTAATPGVITGLSKEVHGLQRQVLKRNSSTTQESGVRRGEDSSNPSLTRTSSRRLDAIEEASGRRPQERARLAAAQVEKRAATKTQKKEPKPGYCENCQDKYDDFDEHIDSRKHRKFADDHRNWEELDDLLGQLGRKPKYPSVLPEWPESPLTEWPASTV